jgi:hypothetical protein
MAASKTMSEPASAPVCEAAARLPGGRAPGLDHQHRLVARRGARRRHELARRARSTRCRAGWRASAGRWPASPACRRSRRRPVRPATRSAKSRCRGRVPSRASPSPARPTATRRPACRAPPRPRARSWRSARCAAASRPRQLGPRMRSRWRRAASSMACARWRPGRRSARPRRACRAAQGVDQRPARWPAACRPRPARAPAAATPRALYTGWPSSSPPLGLTAISGPAKPPWRRLRQTVAPTLPGRAEAPITATDRGSKQGVEVADAHAAMMPAPATAR